VCVRLDLVIDYSVSAWEEAVAERSGECWRPSPRFLLFIIPRLSLRKLISVSLSWTLYERVMDFSVDL
jgi:hypothetical protein